MNRSERTGKLRRNVIRPDLITNEQGKYLSDRFGVLLGDRNAAYILKRLKPKEIRRCQQFTEDDEEFIGKIIRLIEEGSLRKRTAKELAVKLKDESQPLKILAMLRHDIKLELFHTSPA